MSEGSDMRITVLRTKKNLSKKQARTDVTMKHMDVFGRLLELGCIG